MLDGKEAWLRPFLAASDTERRKFWQDLDELPTDPPPSEVFREGFAKTLPEGATKPRFSPATKGGGSLGRPRFVVTADWQGGRIAREAKALVPSAWQWAQGKKSPKSHFLECATGAYRSPDPFLAIHQQILFRRLSPDARKLDLEQGVPAGLEALFLGAMGFELGSIHAADRKMEAIRTHLDALPKDWLHKASKTAAHDVEKDFEAWKSAYHLDQPA